MNEPTQDDINRIWQREGERLAEAAYRVQLQRLAQAGVPWARAELAALEDTTSRR